MATTIAAGRRLPGADVARVAPSHHPPLGALPAEEVRALVPRPREQRDRRKEPLHGNRRARRGWPCRAGRDISVPSTSLRERTP